MSELLSISELGAIRELGETGMTTQFLIRRATVISPDSLDYDPYEDLGDDTLDPDGEGAVTGSAYGWFFSRIQQDVTEDSGEIRTIDIHTLRYPVGTDLMPHDVIERIDSGEKYDVIDTNADDTWAEEGKASLRRSE